LSYNRKVKEAFAFTPVEEKLLRLALDAAAAPGEVDNCAVKLLAHWRKRNVTADELLATATSSLAPPVDYGSVVIAFGQFKGKPLREIDPSYLEWVARNCRQTRLSTCLLIERFLADHKGAR
jgi:hypothetical protein